ncbi:MAG: HD domain-containing protein [Nitrospinae bacterium]|nr:HD domain-containing protein [Nitrospinota bacterium]
MGLIANAPGKLSNAIREHGAAVGELMSALSRRGIPCWIVGGAIRDSALGLPVHDVDIVTLTDPTRAVKSFCADSALGFVILDEGRKIARIITSAPPDIKTVDVAMAQGGALDADLTRRDFTINAVAAEPVGGGFEIYDPLGGLKDLQNKILRLASPGSMAEDPVRVLRAHRFLLSHQLEPEASMAQAIKASMAEMGRMPGERLLRELVVILGHPQSHMAFNRMAGDGTLFSLFPELAATRGVTQNRWHHLDVLGHTLETLRLMDAILSAPPEWMNPWINAMSPILSEPVSFGWPRASVLKLAALLHDIGKPSTKAVDDTGKATFHAHEKASAELAKQALTRLRAPNAVTDGVVTLIKNHLRPFIGIVDGGLSPKAASRFIRDMGFWLIPAMFHTLADSQATRGVMKTEERFALEIKVAGEIFTMWEKTLRVEGKQEPLLDGTELMKLFHLPQGKLIGSLLNEVAVARLAGEIHTKEEAMTFVEKLLSSEE